MKQGKILVEKEIRKMLKDFKKDLEVAHEAERLVQMYFTLLGHQDYTFKNVSADPEYYYKGDIQATDSSNRRIYIEVKDDSRIADTGNVLCEDQVYYKDGDYFGRGNMQGDSDIYCVVSRVEKKIYVMDFKVLKEIYKPFGVYKEIEHTDQTTHAYLLPLWVIKQRGAFIAEVDYSKGSPVAHIYNQLEEESKEIARRLESTRKWREFISQYKDSDWLH